MTPPPLIYIAGPYRAPTTWEIDRNIVAARELGAHVARMGAYPVIPHSNTAHFDGLAPDELWLDGTLELLRRCDAVALVEGWGRSSGARGEVREADRRGIPIFREHERETLLRAWIEGWVRV
jgi:hypothetical protein